MEPTNSVQSAEKPDELSINHRAFVAEYQIDRNASAAALRAGYRNGSTGPLLMRDPRVKREIDAYASKHLSAIHKRVGVSLERTLKEAARGAFFDVRKLCHVDGSPKQMHELDEDTASCIAGVDIQEKWEGSGEERRFVGNVIRYKLVDRRGYVDLLMKHLGGYKQDNEQAGAGAVNALADLIGSMRASTLPVVAQVGEDE